MPQENIPVLREPTFREDFDAKYGEPFFEVLKGILGGGGGLIGLGASPAGSVVGAGLGWGAGESLENLYKQQMFGNRSFDPYSPVKEIPVGMAAEAGGLVAGKGLQTALKGILGKEVPDRILRAKNQGFDTDKTWYHGTSRPDRVIDGGGFSQKRATSGPMAYFTDDPKMASSYSTNKSDTSLSYEDSGFENWFKFKPKGSRKSTNLDQAWHYLDPEEQVRFLKEINKVGLDDQGNVVKGDDLGISPDTFKFEFARNGGNGFKAAKELWLNSGAIFNSEEKFLEVLEKAGLDPKKFIFNSPHSTFPAVFPVHLKLKNPIDVQDPKAILEILPKLEAAAKRQRGSSKLGGADLWDKANRDPADWVKDLSEDVQAGKNSHAWTSVPDWVTKELKVLGYDGILDRGGKLGGAGHDVAIPFKGNQVRSVNANFNPSKTMSRDLLASLIAALGVQNLQSPEQISVEGANQ